MENKKYILTDETIKFEGHILYRIEAVRDIPLVVSKGKKGGYIESEVNLSHYGDCWVSDEAKVFGGASVIDNARVMNKAQIYGRATIHENASVGGEAQVFDDAQVSGRGIVTLYAKVYGMSFVSGSAVVTENALVYDNAQVCGEACVRGDAQMCENAFACDYVIVKGESIVFGSVSLEGKVYLEGNARVASRNDYIVFKNWWSSGRHFTWTRSNNMWSVGCFYGTGEELIKKAYEDSPKTGREYERVVKYVESILADEKEDNKADNQ